MGKLKNAISFICVFALSAGMVVQASGTDGNTRSLGNSSDLIVGDTDIVVSGTVSKDIPQGLAYDEASNTLTMTNYQMTSENTGITARNMGEDFTIKLVGENAIVLDNERNSDVTGIYVDAFSAFGEPDEPGSLTIEGPGSLTIDMSEAAGGLGIEYGADLTIKSSVLNIMGHNLIYMFYGITKSATSGEGDITIDDSQINITASMEEADSGWANAGIDAQNGNMTVKDSGINIALTNGQTFGIAVGYRSGGVEGGKFTIQNSRIECETDSSHEAAYNTYFYDMDAGSSYFYAGNTDEDIRQKTFDEAFETEEFMDNRFKGAYSHLIISPVPINEYCNHQWSGWSVLKEPSCTEKGVQTRTCSVCGTADNQDIAALGHNLETEIITPATCTQDGMKREACTRCEYYNGEAIIPATGHNYTWVTVKEATFHEDGLEKGTCENCGDVVTQTIPKLSESHVHDFSGKEEIIKEAACTENGSKKVYCTEPECGAFVLEAIPMTEHTPGEWTVIRESTCSEEGQEQRTCAVCGTVTDRRAVDKLPHTYNEWEEVTPATCTEAGVEYAKCAVCGEETLRGINALGHNYEWKVTEEPTYEKEGRKEAVCSVCNQKISQTIPKLTETQTDGQEAEQKNATAAPQTGDSNKAILYTVLLAAASAVIIKYRKIIY